MLKVPSAIEGAYRTAIGDTSYGKTAEERHKEIRIHFPNGELPDIWNDNIVQESFSFTESVCSSDSFKFGLCEAAEVTFETVNIKENISGCKIEVFFEIDVSDLESVYQCAGRYISDPEEGVDKDNNNCNRDGDEVARGVYSIPIGTFTVIEAERSKSDMTHRSIRAVTKVFETNDDMTSFEQWRIAQLHKTKKFTMDIPNYIDTQVGMVGTEYGYDIDNDDYRDLKKDGKVKDSAFPIIDPIDPKFKGMVYGDQPNFGGDDYIYITLASTISKQKEDTYYQENNEFYKEEMYPYVYTVLNRRHRICNIRTSFDYIDNPDYPGYPYRAIENVEGSFDRFYTDLKNFIYNVSYVNVYGETVYPYRVAYPYFENITDKKKKKLREFYRNYILTYGVRYSDKVGSYFSIDDSPYAYVYDSGLKTTGRIIIPTVVYIRFQLTYDGAQHQFDARYAPSMYYAQSPLWSFSYGYLALIGYYKKILFPSPSNQPMALKFDNTLDTKAKTYRYSFYNAFTMRDIIVGWLEINAKFGHQKRNGKYEYLKLPGKDSFTREINSNEFEKLYYDEFDIDDIGYVIYKYKKNKDDKEVEVIYDLGTGGTSIYDMTDNPIFTILDEDESTSDSRLKIIIEAIIYAYFRPELEIIHYYPSEIKLHSKPYLEAGDCYKVFNSGEYGLSFYTYNLNMTISGIQNTTTEMSSTTGQIIDGSILGVTEEDDDT